MEKWWLKIWQEDKISQVPDPQGKCWLEEESEYKQASCKKNPKPYQSPQKGFFIKPLEVVHT